MNGQQTRDINLYVRDQDGRICIREQHVEHGLNRSICSFQKRKEEDRTVPQLPSHNSCSLYKEGFRRDFKV